jgi:hypothetical protein
MIAERDTLTAPLAGESSVAYRCARCSGLHSASPLVSEGQRFLCWEYVKLTQIVRCRAFIKQEPAKARPALEAGLAVLQGCSDAAWWRENVLTGIGWLLTTGAGEIVGRFCGQCEEPLCLCHDECLHCGYQNTPFAWDAERCEEEVARV